MSFGGTTVTFVKLTEDLTNRDRYGNPNQTSVSTDVPGCLFRPAKFTETSPLDTQLVLQMWKITAPPVPAVMAATATDSVIVNGVTYQISGGAEVFDDFSGQPFKCTIYCDLQLY